MPKYLLRASYTHSGAAGPHQGWRHQAGRGRPGGGCQRGRFRSRRSYWAFGEDDYYGIFDLPSNAAAAALSLAVAATGAVGTKTHGADDGSRRR